MDFESMHSCGTLQPALVIEQGTPGFLARANRFPPCDACLSRLQDDPFREELPHYNKLEALHESARGELPAGEMRSTKDEESQDFLIPQ